MKDLLLEIGCENLPASYVPPAIEQLRDDASRLLDELRLSHEGIYTTGTPRRIILHIKELASIQKTKTETATGPPLSKSFDEEGRPTPAAKGFAKSRGIRVSQLKPVDTGRGEYIGFVRRLKSRKASSLLREHLPGLISGLRFPKTMRWESKGTRFARPVRWIVCLHGSAVIKFRFAGVVSGNISLRVPWLKKETIKVSDAASYLQAMKKRGILVDHKLRRAEIERLAVEAASRAGLTLVEDPGLFDEINFMLEEPGAFIGDFPAKYLSLPPEVVVTAMKAHQRYFALRGGDKKLVSRFLAYYDGKKRSIAAVKRGNEKVLMARLEDALFYWQEDLKKGIDTLAGLLGGIVFIEGLGSIKDKAARLARLMDYINDAQSERPLLPETIERLARLSKADLASEMVKDGKEFTLLEGLIGSHYARISGEAPEIVRAIREQYDPRSPSDPLPRSMAGTFLSIANRTDTICGCFLAGFQPTGSQDPYGLRRQAVSLVRIVEKYPLAPLDGLLQRSVSLYRDAGIPDGADYESALRNIAEFFQGRMESYLKERGIEYDIVDAVIPLAWMMPGKCMMRCRSLQKIRRKKSFELLITGAKRLGNILPKDKKVYGIDWEKLEHALAGAGVLVEGISFSEDLFEDPAEVDLLEETRARLPDLADLEQRDDFTGILNVLSSLGPVIDRYFDKVLVNCENEELRKNRIHFLASMFALFSRYADFSHIVESGESFPS